MTTPGKHLWMTPLGRSLLQGEMRRGSNKVIPSLVIEEEQGANLEAGDEVRMSRHYLNIPPQVTYLCCTYFTEPLCMMYYFHISHNI